MKHKTFLTAEKLYRDIEKYKSKIKELQKAITVFNEANNIVITLENTEVFPKRETKIDNISEDKEDIIELFEKIIIKTEQKIEQIQREIDGL